MLQLKEVSKKFPNGKFALEKITFSLQPAEMIFITGHSGAGKSSLLKSIALIERHTEGEIFFENESLTKMKKNKIPDFRRELGLIFQDPHLLQDRSVFNNVALPLIISGDRYQQVHRKVRGALDKVSLLDKEYALPNELSVGEQHRVSIARAIVNKPKLILADEPTGNLDPALSLEIFNVFKQLNQVGASVIITTHDLHLLRLFDHRKIILQKGRIIE